MSMWYNDERFITGFVNNQVFMFNNFVLCENVQTIELPINLIEHKERIKKEIEERTKVKIKIKNESIIF